MHLLVFPGVTSRCAWLAALLALAGAGPRSVRPEGPEARQARGDRAAPGGQEKTEKAARAKLELFGGTLDEAYLRAFDRNVPLVLVAIVEDEGFDEKEHEDVEKLRRGLVEDPALAEALRHAMLLLGCNRVHALESVEVELDGRRTRREMCTRYGTPSCTGHLRPFEEIYGAFNEDGLLLSPFVLVLGPDRKESQRFASGRSPSLADLLEALALARKNAGEGLTDEGLEQVRALLRLGQDHGERRVYGAAWRSLEGVLAITQKTRYADDARARAAQALAGLGAQRDEARAWLAGERVVDGYRRLVELSADAQGTPLEREIAKELKQAETDKRTKEKVAGYKRELEAEALLREVESLLAQGQDRKAEAKGRGLLKRFGDTPAGARARERWPAWARE